MGFIPHPPIFLAQVRPHDMLLLLGIGAAWELAARVFLFAIKSKPSSLAKKEEKLQTLNAEAARKRKLGPSAFVETSKLERQVLALEKDVDEIRVARTKTVQTMEKRLLRFGNLILALVIFVLYYGIPMLTIQALEQREIIEDLDAVDPTGTFFKALLFPVSYVGFGTKISKWGIDSEIATSSIGALVVMWSSQVTVGKLFDSVDAYFL